MRNACKVAELAQGLAIAHELPSERPIIKLERTQKFRLPSNINGRRLTHHVSRAAVLYAGYDSFLERSGSIRGGRFGGMLNLVQEIVIVRVESRHCYLRSGDHITALHPLLDGGCDVRIRRQNRRVSLRKAKLSTRPIEHVEQVRAAQIRLPRIDPLPRRKIR